MNRTAAPANLAVTAALVAAQVKVRTHVCPSRMQRSSVLTKPQHELIEEKCKLAAEARRERRNAKRVKL